MKIPIWITEILFLGTIALIILFLSIIQLKFFEWIKQKKLERLIKNKISVDKINFNDFRNLQKVNYVNDTVTLQALEKLKADIDFDITPESKEIKPRLDLLITDFVKKEPFSDFPPKIKEMLSLEKNRSSDPVAIDRLAEKLNVYIKRQARWDLFMRVIAIIGAIMGVVGCIQFFYK
ncbi:hypothetical protein [Proteus faecis]|uniref:Uncharacterized protein n=1 Tax=Proteus faecis TaxID=2050967 RepID=A0ABZ3EI61_9GAMM